MAGTILLFIHIAAGSIALLTAVVALLMAKGGRYHVLAGRVYAIAMTVIFLTSLPLAILGASVFLLLIAVFSFYLVFAGWRFARNRRGVPQLVDWSPPQPWGSPACPCGATESRWTAPATDSG